MQISHWLTLAEKRLSSVSIPSAQLDAELILITILAKPRTYLHAHPEEIMDDTQLKEAAQLLDRRLDREPLAYIFGKKEFYGRDFIVNSDTLIPRPESETIIDILKEQNIDNYTMIDVGTGSGALAVTLKLEFPNSQMIATDVSEAALHVAKQNATTLGATVTFYKSNLLSNLPNEIEPDIIVANLPYVDVSWQVSPETVFEPQLALFADDNGLALIKQLIKQARGHLPTDGALVLEADPRQHEAIISYGAAHSFQLQKVQDFIVILQKI